MIMFRSLLSAGVLVVFALTFLPNCTAQYQHAKQEAKEYIANVEDMMFPYEEVAEGIRKKRNAIPIGSRGVWPNGVVPYDFSTNFAESEKRIIFQAMQHWEDFTCIRFREKTESDVFSILFVVGNPGTCRSYIGKVTLLRLQPQPVTLGSGCTFFPTVVHELGHAVGFYHEHSRPDRDEYITVVKENIITGLVDSFSTISPFSSNSFGFGYDYASIMHYSPTTFSRTGTDTIVSNDPEIHFGDAAELSPLDIAKANALYQCGPRDTHPPRSITVPDAPPASLPDGFTCGSVIEVTGPGRVQSPGFPAHRTNQECAFILRAPEGYGFQFSFPGFQLEQSSECTKDYVKIYSGASLSPRNQIIYSGFPGGRFCTPQVGRFIFSLDVSVITFHYRTDGFNVGSVRGLDIDYNLKDVNECGPQNNKGRRCHTCTNTQGSFECGCNKGFYLSAPANACFDVNECAVEIDGKKGGCDHICVNFAGSYQCRCRSGFHLQTDGKSCGTTAPRFAPTALPPGTSLPRVQTSPTPATSTIPPTTTPTTIPPTNTLPAQCGGGLSVRTASSGSIQSLGWPNTAYPLNIECTWDIVCPAGSTIEITFEERFRIAGQMPICNRDFVRIADCNGAIEHGPFCHVTRPEPFETSCSAVKVTFDSNGVRGGSRTGFRMNYVCKTPSTVATTRPTTPTTRPTTPTTRPTTPTTQPTTPTTRPTTPTTQPTTPTTRPTTPTTQPTTPTTRPTTQPPTTAAPTVSAQCGGGPRVRRDSQGSIQTLGWPSQAYPLNVNCDWTITCPPTQRVRITFEDSFRVAGQMPACDKDKLKVVGCGNTRTYCHLTAPQPMTSECNSVDVSFDSLAGRGTNRIGFRLNYECI